MGHRTSRPAASDYDKSQALSRGRSTPPRLVEVPVETRAPFRVTRNVLSVLAALTAADRSLYGLKLMEVTRLPSGSMYPILDRLEQAGWIAGEWEQLDPSAAKRPRRRNYSLTQRGQRGAHHELDEARRMIAVSPKPSR